jgi:hypothetical protein
MQIPARCGIKVILHIIWTLSTETLFLFDMPFAGIPVWHTALACVAATAAHALLTTPL